MPTCAVATPKPRTAYRKASRSAAGNYPKRIRIWAARSIRWASRSARRYSSLCANQPQQTKMSGAAAETADARIRAIPDVKRFVGELGALRQAPAGTDAGKAVTINRGDRVLSENYESLATLRARRPQS